MTITTKQLRTARRLDDKVRALEEGGADDVAIFRDMADLMPDFKHLMDTAGQAGMDELCARFPGLYHYARILENVARALQAGVLKAGRDF